MELSTAPPAMESAIRVRGTIMLEVREADGTLADRRVCRNLVTNAGVGAVAAAVGWSGITDVAAAIGASTVPSLLSPIQLAVGTGTAAPTYADTALGSELARSAVTAYAAANGTLSWTGFFGSSQAVGTISEAGAFVGAGTAPGSGVLLDRVLITPALSKTSTQTMTILVSLTMLDSAVYNGGTAAAPAAGTAIDGGTASG